MNKSFRLSPQFVFGICIIVLGLLFTLDNLELIDARYYLHFWPAIFVLVGLLKLIQPSGTPGKILGFGLLAVGSLMILDRLDLIDFTIWQLWPIVIILFGFSLVRGAVMRQHAIETGSPEKPRDSDSFIKGFAFMGGVVRNNDSQSFQGGELTAVMGGCEIDLRRASISNGEAQIEIFTFWGGVEIKVPEDWSVVNKVVPIMGGIDDKSVPPKGGPVKRLVITGYAIMGGAEIRN
jgi:predicted membrane protein